MLRCRAVRGRTPAATAALATSLALGACGGGAHHVPDLARVPLLPGARVLTQVQRCDKGAGAYCSIELVVADRRFASADDFLLAERKSLHAHGWTGANGDTGEESAADSPGHKLHLTYATAAGDLDGWDKGWIERQRRTVLTLSSSVFDRTAALSMLLEFGSQGS